MRIVFVGGGAATLFSSIYLKKKNPDLDILIFEKSDNVGKKLSMTGNGKCNLAPIEGEYSKKYNHPDFVKRLFDEIDDEEYRKILSFVGIETKYLDNRGLYPISESTKNVLEILKSQINSLGIQIINEEVIDYVANPPKNKVITKNGEMKCDLIVFATGGKSYPKTGSDGSMFNVLKKHGYEVVEPTPSLCPIKVNENVHDLFGTRLKGSVSLLQDGRVIDKEDGEIMFKKDGLSGICVMNLSRHIDNKKYEISLDVLNNQKVNETSSDKYQELLKYIPINLAKYLLKKNPNKDIKSLLTDIRFTVKEKYSFDEAQVTKGGLKIDQINNEFLSKKEPHVIFVGEMLDIDGPCGGYNLRFAVTSAIKAITPYIK